MRLENFTYADSNMSQRIFNSFLSVDFLGVTGPTSFSATGDTKSLVKIVRLQGMFIYIYLGVSLVIIQYIYVHRKRFQYSDLLFKDNSIC